MFLSAPYDYIKETMRQDVVDATTTYIGYAKPALSIATSAAQWHICKVTSSGGNVTAIQWASDSYDKIWDNRASLNYS